MLTLALGLLGVSEAQDTSLISTQTVFFQREYDLYSTDVLLQSVREPANYGDLRAAFRYEGGPYRLAQAAPDSRQFSFSTRGTRQLGAYRLSGEFGYNHQLLDSVGFTLRQGLEEPAPYYFFSWKKGNWQTGQYRLRAGISRKWGRDRLSAGIAVRNQALNAWRSNDPRPEQFNFQLGADAGVSYRIDPRHRLGLAGSVDSRKEDNSVDYRNTDYQLSLAYPEYVRRLQFGYGMEDRAANAELKTKGNGWGWKLYYFGDWGKQQLNIWGGYSYRETSFRGDSTRFFPAGRYGDFFEDKTEAGIYWRYCIQQHLLSLRADYSYLLGQDYNYFLGANNYVYARESLRIEPLYQRLRGGRPLYELGLTWALTDLFRADGNAGVETDYQFWETSFTGSYFISPPNSVNTWQLKMTLATRQPVAPEITVPVQQSEFVKQVVLADYQYYDAAVYSAIAAVRLSRPFGKNSGFLQVEGGAMTASGSGGPSTDWRPGTGRYHVECTIGINLRP